MKILSETNRNLVRIMVKAGISIKERRYYIEEVNRYLRNLRGWPERLLYRLEKQDSFLFNAEDMGESIESYLFFRRVNLSSAFDILDSEGYYERRYNSR